MNDALNVEVMDLPQSTKAGSYRNTKAWKELRLKVLEDYPTCVWCKRRPSTEADHVIPVDAGIDPMDRSNLVGSCRPCNGRRGAQHGNKKAQKGIQGPIRPRRAREPQTVFGSPSEAPPAPLPQYRSLQASITGTPAPIKYTA